MKSSEIKAHILWHALYRLHFVAAITENGHGCMGVADVFGILESGYTVEFEIKTSKADLMGEIRSIRAIAEKLDLFNQARAAGKATAYAKYPKHRLYIDGSSMYSQDVQDQLEMRPNKYFFAVPGSLLEVAKEGLKGTPYGLYVIDEFGTPVCKKRADLLHPRKASDRLKMKILRSACTEVETTRSNLAAGLLCTGCRVPLATVCTPCVERRATLREYRKENDRVWREREEARQLERQKQSEEFTENTAPTR